MAITLTYAEFETPDVANLTHNGVFYRCVVWRNVLDPAGFDDIGDARIEAAIYVEQEQGQQVLHSSHVVAVPVGESTSVFYPRVLASGSTFVVHWVDGERTGPSFVATLFRATLDMSTFQSFPSWDNRGSVALHEDMLYDASAAEDDTASGRNFLVVRRTGPALFALTRYSGFDWVDTDWTENIGVANERVLTVYAHSGDDDVVVAYGDAGALRVLRRNYSDGGVGANVGDDLFPQCLSGFTTSGDFTAAGICRIGTSLVAVVAEYAPGDYQTGSPTGENEWLTHADWLMYAAVNSNTAVQSGNDHCVPNLNLLSRPWAYPASELGATPAMHVYAAVGYKSLPTGLGEGDRGWTQSLAFIADFDRASWGEAAGTVRPWACVNLQGGPIYDARPCGATAPTTVVGIWADARRINHISHVSGPRVPGTLIKTRVVANVVFMRLQQASFEFNTVGLQPATAAVLLTRVHMEDPWTISRDALIGTSPPAEVFRGTGALSPYQHAVAGRGLVIGGGTPCVYDGRQIVELNHLWTNEITHAESQDGIGLAPNAQYLYTVTPQWRDAKGQLHRGPPSKPLTLTTGGTPAAATGTITCLAATDMEDGDRVTLIDSSGVEITFWFDVSGTFEPPGGYDMFNREVSIAGLTDVQVAATLEVAIDGAPFDITASAALAVVTVTQGATGPDGNTPIVKNVSDEDFAVSGFAGGTFGDPQQVTLRIRSQNLSLKDNITHYPTPGAGISLVIYRTAWDAANETFAEGGTFFQLFGGGKPVSFWVGDTPKNDPYQPITTVFDTLSDAQLRIHARLPFALDASGNWTPPEPIAPPAFTVIANHANRVWGATRWGEIWYSDEVLPEPGGIQYVVPEFHNVNRFRVDGIGLVTAMQSMDDVLIVLTRDRIFALVGVGNDLSGTGSSLALQVLAEGTGCIEARSVVLGPPGIFFQSAKGYYLLNRGKELDYSPPQGASIDEELRTGGNVRAAVLMEDRHLILVSTNGAVTGFPRTLAFDYYRRMWFDWQHAPLSANLWQSSMASACAWRGHQSETAHVILQQGRLAYEHSETDTDAFADTNDNGMNAPVKIDVQLAWIHMSGIAGAKKLWRIGLQMEKPQASAVHFEMGYDWTGGYNEDAPDGFEEFQNGEPTAANGWIRCIDKVLFTSPGGDNVVLDDGVNPPVTFWFDVSGSFIPPGGYDATNIEVDISADTTAQQVAVRLRTAINSVGATLTITGTTVQANGRLTLTHDTLGTVGNVPIVENVEHPKFAVYGMSGGADLGATSYVELNPRTQYLTAYTLRIFENDDVPTTENLSLTSITAEYGVEPGTRKVARTQKGQIA